MTSTSTPSDGSRAALAGARANPRLSAGGPLGPVGQGLPAHAAACLRPNTRSMFVERSVQIDHPVQAVAAVLAAGPREWFARLDDLGRSAIGPQVAGIVVREKVAVGR